MSSRTRFFASCTAFAIALVALATTESSAGAAQRFGCEEVEWDMCDEGLVGQTMGHEFGAGGAPYTCAPNTCHGSTQVGYCHTYHVGCGDM